VVVASTNAQFLGMPFGGLGFGMGAIGPGFFGRIFPPFIPHMRPGLMMRNGIGFGLGALSMFGKRDVESQQQRTLVTEATCVLSTQSSRLKCSGDRMEKIDCEIEPTELTTPSTRFAFFDLTFKPTVVADVEFLELIAPSSSGSKFTYVDASAHKNVLLSVYSDAGTNEPGFRVKDPKCFGKVVELVKQIEDNLKVGISFSTHV